MRKIILDLCGGTGSWSTPYAEAGYDVRVITMPEHDARLWNGYLGLPVHGILAAPPCTYFCTMHNCRGKATNEQLLEGLSVVDACLRIVRVSKPAWWALENPEGSLKHWLGTPYFKFQPCDYGDPWTKKTFLWGQFNVPVFAIATNPEYSYVNSGRKFKNGPAHNARTRSMTPPGFANAFFAANP